MSRKKIEGYKGLSLNKVSYSLIVALDREARLLNLSRERMVIAVLTEWVNNRLDSRSISE